LTSKEILSHLQNEVSVNDYERYLKQLVYKKSSSSDDIAVFEVGNKFIANYIKTKYRSIIQEAFEKFEDTKPSIEIKIAGERRRSKKEILDEKSIIESGESTILNQSYTFE